MKVSVSYSSHQENKASRILILSLGSSRMGIFLVKETNQFSMPQSEIKPAEFTNHSACTNLGV